MALIAHYKLDDDADSTVVLDVKGTNGTAQRNTSAMHVDGRIDGALNFNGSSDYVDTNQTFNSVFQDSFSIALWTKPNQDTNRGLFGRYYFSGDSIWITNLLSSVNFYYDADGDTGLYMSASETFSEQWVFIVFTAKKNSANSVTFKIYKDGSPKLFRVGAGGSITEITKSFDMSTFSVADNIYIGNDSDDSAYCWPGDIDDVKIFDKALTAEEVTSIYNEAFTTFVHSGKSTKYYNTGV